MRFRRFIAVLLLAILPALCRCGASRYDEAIAAAVAYLNSRGDQLQSVAVPILGNLQRQYQIGVDIAAAEKKALSLIEGRRRVFQRHMRGGVTASRDDIMKLRGIDHITAAALYCDLYGLPKYFFRAVRSMASRGGYDLTHAMLALVIVRNQRCNYDREVFRRELTAEIRQLRTLLAENRVDSDLGIEAILMLHLSRKSPDMAGEPSHVNPEWIEQILAAQSADGSWYQNDHTTVLALWLLLELKHS